MRFGVTRATSPSALRTYTRSVPSRRTSKGSSSDQSSGAATPCSKRSSALGGPDAGGAARSIAATASARARSAAQRRVATPARSITGAASTDLGVTPARRLPPSASRGASEPACHPCPPSDQRSRNASALTDEPVAPPERPNPTSAAHRGDAPDEQVVSDGTIWMYARVTLEHVPRVAVASVTVHHDITRWLAVRPHLP